MATRDDLVDWLYDALKASNGRGRIVDLCKHVWEAHEYDLRESGDLFYTWQYDIRWAAQKLRDSGKLKSATVAPRGIWEIAEG